MRKSLRKDSKRCFWCYKKLKRYSKFRTGKNPEDMRTKDHIWPLAFGGQNWWEWSCYECNELRAKIQRAYESHSGAIGIYCTLLIIIKKLKYDMSKK